MDELVSIIVPVYKVEKYIKDCLLSICKQDYRNIEIIAVNDGSPDNCLSIMESIKQLDSRLIIIDKGNEGVSAARNEGLQIAKGEFVLFVDGDDFLEPNCVSYFLSLFDSNIDVVMNHSYYSVWNKTPTEKNGRAYISADLAIEEIYLGKIDVAVWNKMYRRVFLENNAIRFNVDYWYGEGMLFNIECLQKTDTIVVGNQCVYHQTYNLESAMRKFNIESNRCGIRSLDYQKNIWEKTNRHIEHAWYFHRWSFFQTILFGLLKNDLVDSHKELYKECVKGLRRGSCKASLARIGWKRKIAVFLLGIAPVIFVKRNVKVVRERERRLAEVGE